MTQWQQLQPKQMMITYTDSCKKQAQHQAQKLDSKCEISPWINQTLSRDFNQQFPKDLIGSNLNSTTSFLSKRRLT